jgi:hypothetical protein
MVIDALVAPFQVLARQRPVITTFVQREIRTRYITSALGIGWALIRPLLLLILYTFVFSIVLKVPFGGTTSTLDAAFYIFCGMVPWLAFADGITRATTRFRTGSAGEAHALSVRDPACPPGARCARLESLGLVILLARLIVRPSRPGGRCCRWPRS